jgi:hypothetical chaperone protein
MSAVLGIDFGTSNTTACLVKDDAAQMVALEGEHTSLPTCIFFNTEDKANEVTFGRAAQALYRQGYDGRLLRALKSILGTALAGEATAIGYRAYKLADVLALFLRHIKTKAEQQAGEKISRVVLGRPVHFIDGDPAADAVAEAQLRAVAQQAGFGEISFQFEPMAAALAYEAGLKHSELVLVADLGGGTADFSLLRLDSKRHHKADRSKDVIGHGGIHIGGTDLDRVLSIAAVMPHLGLGTRYRDKGLQMPSHPYHTLATWHKINLLYTPRALMDAKEMTAGAAEPARVIRLQNVLERRGGHALAQLVESAKIALTDEPQATINLSPIGEALDIEVRQSTYERAIAELVTEIGQNVSELLTQTQVKAADVQTLFFTGGTSAVPAVRRALMALLPTAKVVDGDPMAAVGLGLGLYARTQFNCK